MRLLLDFEQLLTENTELKKQIVKLEEKNMDLTILLKEKNKNMYSKDPSLLLI